MKSIFLLLGALALLLLVGCGTSHYTLSALPFSIELSSYELLESEQSYIFSPLEKGGATLVFDKDATRLSFFELFKDGYDELTEKSQGVWVICAKGDWTDCYVQNLDFPELYPLHLQKDGVWTEEDRETLRKLLLSLKKD